MKKPIYVVGGAGYIGQRLLERLVQMYPQSRVTCVDLQAPKRFEPYVIADATEWEPGESDSVVIWMASIQEPSHMVERKWAEAIMVDSPADVLYNEQCSHMVYFSSIRAMTALRLPDRQRTLYSVLKREGEEAVAENCGSEQSCVILRPGTVFGGFRDGLPVRTTTVPNKYLLTGELPDENYQAFICPMTYIVEVAALRANPDLMLSRNTVNNVGFEVPYTAAMLPTLRSSWCQEPPPKGSIVPCTDTNEIIARYINEQA